MMPTLAPLVAEEVVITSQGAFYVWVVQGWVRYRQCYPGTGTGTWELARCRYKYTYWIFQKYLGTGTGTLIKYLGTGTQILCMMSVSLKLRYAVISYHLHVYMFFLIFFSPVK